MFGKLFGSIGFFIHQIPLIDQNNNPLVILSRQIKYFLILTFKSTCGIHHQKNDIGIFNGTNGTHYRIKLNIFFDFIFTPDTGSINQIKFLIKFIVTRSYRITSSAGNIRNNVTLLTQQRINQCGLSCIRASYHREFRNVAFFFFPNNIFG